MDAGDGRLRSALVEGTRKNLSEITKPVDCSTGPDVFTHLTSPVWLLVRGPHRRRPAV